MHVYLGTLFLSPEDLFRIVAVVFLTGKCQNLRPAEVPTDFLYPDLSQNWLFLIWVDC